MASPRILYFGRNQAMMALIGHQLKAAGMDAQGYQDESLLTLELAEKQTALLVIGGGVEDEPRERLRKLCEELEVQIFEHFGGPTALMERLGTVFG